MIPQVYNLKDKNCPEDAIYIGRKNVYYHLPESKWANPFRIGTKYGTLIINRNMAIALHKDWLFNTTQGQLLLSDISELKGKDLKCWCKPQDCHGDTLIIMANAPKIEPKLPYCICCKYMHKTCINDPQKPDYCPDDNYRLWLKAKALYSF